jgi:hypothetical protein
MKNKNNITQFQVQKGVCRHNSIDVKSNNNQILNTISENPKDIIAQLDKSEPIIGSAESTSTLFRIGATSSHLFEQLKKLNHPEKSIQSMIYCGQPNANMILKQCVNGCPPEKIDMTWKCNLRTCPECSKRRKRRIRNQYMPFLSKFARPKHGYRLRFLTISPANYTNLEFGLKDIRNNFNKFIRRKYIMGTGKKYPVGHPKYQSKKIKAGIYVIEANRNWPGKKIFKKDGTHLYTCKKHGWNVHIHAIIYSKYLDNRVGGYKNQRNYYTEKNKDSPLTSEWMKTSKKPVNMNISSQSSVLYSLNYMLKYISTGKGDFQTVEDQALYIKTVHNTRLINKFGIFYNVKIIVVKPIYTCNICNGPAIFGYPMSRMQYDTDPPPKGLYKFGFEKIKEIVDLPKFDVKKYSKEMYEVDFVVPNIVEEVIE